MSAPLILGTNSIKDVGYNVDNSVRFNSGSSDHLTRSLASTNTSWTFSAWVKRSQLNLTNYLISWGNSGTDGTGIGFTADDGYLFYYSESSPDNKYRLTSAKHRDVSAWYHIVCKSDSSAITLYVNGEEPTQSWSTGSSGNPLDTSTMAIGKWVTSNFYHNGYMAEVCFIDGTALNPTSFGEFDEDSGIWKPIDVSGLTFGTNGFYLDFEDSSALGNDVSGNNNDFTVNNLTSIDQTTDTCTNNYATLNPLGVTGATSFANLSNGNLTYTGNASTYGYVASTIGVSSGKWYFEAKLTKKPNTNTEIGIADLPSRTNTQMLGVTDPNSISFRGNGNVYKNNSALSWSGSTYVLNDIVGVALDLDNNRLFFSINGTFQNSADPTTSTGAISITAPENLGTTGAYFFAVGDQIGYDTAIWQCNFGNPPFTISSGNSDGNGYGNFEYSVPSGYYALNTKNLAEYG